MNYLAPFPRCLPELLCQQNGELQCDEEHTFQDPFIVDNAPSLPSFTGDLHPHIQMEFSLPDYPSLKLNMTVFRIMFFAEIIKLRNLK